MAYTKSTEDTAFDKIGDNVKKISRLVADTERLRSPDFRQLAAKIEDSDRKIEGMCAANDAEIVRLKQEIVDLQPQLSPELQGYGL